MGRTKDYTSKTTKLLINLSDIDRTICLQFAYQQKEFPVNKKSIVLSALLAAASVFTLGACTTAPMSAPAAPVRFIAPADGAVVTSPFKVVFGVTGLEVKPAGEEIENTKAGHHHLIINGAPIKAGESVPFNDTHIHFGKGQTETMVELKPGTYKLTMQFANGAHQSYGEPRAATITVTVK